jgi:hypothetical protein
MEKKEIKYIVVEDVGAVFQSDGDIVEFTENGEMALVKWYRQQATGREFNGKYVIEIKYFVPPTQL